MRTLIVDDQYEKVEVLVSILRELGNTDYSHVTCSRDAINSISRQKVDLMILDLQIPDNLGEPVKPTGGRELLEYIDMNISMHSPTHIIAVTAHQESYDLCESFFEERGWSLILGVDDKKYLRTLIESKMKHCIDECPKYDIAIVTALEHTELEAVLALPCEWKKTRIKNDCNCYHSGEILLNNGEKKSVIATSCPRMGMASAAAVAMKVCLKFQPEYLIMTGILAGIAGKVRIGDIIVADVCWDWGSGKQTIVDDKVTFLNAPYQIALDPHLRTTTRTISTNRTYMDEIYCEWDSASRPGHSLNLHVGPIATGAVVLEDPGVVDFIRSQHRDTLGIEMEAYGVFAAAQIAGIPSTKVLIIKSVCDFADPIKNDEWQGYASFTSSRFAFKLIENHLFT